MASPPTNPSCKKNLSNCEVEIKFGKTHTEIDYTTGVHQGDNMSPILFLYVILAFTETLHLDALPAQFVFFPDKKKETYQRVKEDY